MADQCPPATGVALQVLGSGGPIADDGRASSSYLIWVDGKSRVLIDAGGGAFLRFGEVSASFSELSFVGLSHFHADHSVDFPALLKSGSFENRTEALVVGGPDGSDVFPGLNQFLASLLDGKTGAFAYMGDYLNGSGRLPKLTALEVDSKKTAAVTLLGNSHSEIQIDAMHVPHGIVPALAFRVRIQDEVIVFAGDQTGGDQEFIDFTRGANILVMHMPVPEGVSGVARQLHAPPSVIGTIANHADIKKLILSHFMKRSLNDLEKNVDVVRSKFGGALEIATDLRCYPLNSKLEE